MKKITCMILLVMLFFSLSACERAGDSSRGSNQTQTPPAVDPKIMAEEEFRSAVQNLSDAQASLRERIPAAEELLETITEDEVDDPSVLENLRDIAASATAILEVPIPEMESDSEEIQQQVQSVSEQENTTWDLFYGLDHAIEQVEESQQRWVESNRTEIIMAKAEIGNKYNYTIYSIDPETGEERTISEFSIPGSVISRADGSRWTTYPMYIPTFGSRLPLRGMFSTNYNYMAVSRYSIETGETHAGFYKAGEELRYVDVTKSIGAGGSDFDDLTVQLALGFTDSNQFIFADATGAPASFIYRTDYWTAYQVKVSDTGNVSSSQSYNDLNTFLMEGDSWSWIGEHWELTDWIDDTRCLINYPEESVATLGGIRIDRWGVRIFDTVTQELSSFIPGESRSNWSGVISPDGRSIAFLSAPARGTGNAALYVTSIDGGEPMKVLDNIPSGREHYTTMGHILTRPTTEKTVYFLLEWRKTV